MTNDLVKQLREKAFRAETYEMLEAAADRIETLEAALRDLSDGWECCPVPQAMRRVAREALEDDR